MTTQPIDNATRLRIATMTSLCGLGTAILMSEFTTGLHRHLPDHGFHLAAVLGAWIAGFVFAGGFGRNGVSGCALAALTAVGATMLGAGLGAMLISDPRLGALNAIQGWLALLFLLDDGVGPVKVWASMMLLLHLYAGHLRGKGCVQHTPQTPEINP